MKFDDASWHYGGEFPADLPSAAGATHIAMFVAWGVLNGLASELHQTEGAADLARLKAREVTPVEWFTAACDEKFTNEDLTDEGNLFASSYYGGDDGIRSGHDTYLADYEQAFPGLPSTYHVPRDWRSYDRLAPILSRRLEAWRRAEKWKRLLGRLRHWR